MAHPRRARRSALFLGALVVLGTTAILLNYARTERRRMEFQTHIARALHFCEMNYWPGILSETRAASAVAEDERFDQYSQDLADKFRRRECELPPWPKADSSDVERPFP